MLCLSGFELYSRWVPLIRHPLVSLPLRPSLLHSDGKESV